MWIGSDGAILTPIGGLDAPSIWPNSARLVRPQANERNVDSDRLNSLIGSRGTTSSSQRCDRTINVAFAIQLGITMSGNVESNTLRGRVRVKDRRAVTKRRILERFG